MLSRVLHVISFHLLRPRLSLATTLVRDAFTNCSAAGAQDEYVRTVLKYNREYTLRGLAIARLSNEKQTRKIEASMCSSCFLTVTKEYQSAL